MIGCTGTLEIRLLFSRRGRVKHAYCADFHFLEVAADGRRMEEQVENIKGLALTAWDVLIFIICINDTLRGQER